MTERAPKQKVPESGVLKACLDLLAAEKIWHRRWNTGAVKTGKRFFRFGKSGDADILAVLRQDVNFLFGELHCDTGPDVVPQVLWIECKSESGRQSTEQWLFQKEVEGEGHHYLLVRDVDTMRNWLRERGIIQ